MKNAIVALAVITLSGVATPAFAQDSGGVSIGVSGGTLGVGPEVGFRASETIGVRANATFLGISRGVDSDGVDYDGDLKLNSYGAMLDVYPFGGGFRLSGGARISKNRLDLKATPTGTVEIGDTDYTAAQIGVLTGRVEPKDFAPTLTLGYGGGLGKGLKLGIDAGVMFQGSPKVTNLTATGTAAGNSAFQASLDQERAEIEDDIDNFKLYPILQLSLGYRF